MNSSENISREHGRSSFARRRGRGGCFQILLLACVSVFFIAAVNSASAATLTGTVTNGTTNKPAAGDEVILIKLASGMEEAGHTKADAQGKFSFNLDETNRPHLIRAIHQGVTYHQMAPPEIGRAHV